MRRGEIFEYLPPNGGPAHWPVCALVVRRPTIAHPYRAALADMNPLGGAVGVAPIGPLNPARMRGPEGC